jgi:hypothetical protein
MKFIWDERTESLSGKIATIFLGLTQVGILGIILYRRYYLGQPEEAYSDLRAVLAFSVFGYIAARLYFGALIPKFSLKSLALIYAGFVLFLFVVLSLWFGLPTLDNWQNTILPVVVGPAILAGGFWLFSWLGRRRSP